MKKALIGIAAIAAIIGPPARAADMAVKAPIVTKAPPVAVSTWTGCYGGINGGAAWGRSNINTTFSAPPGLFVSLPFANEADRELSPHLHPVGGTAGAQLGCNWQSSSFVAGIETDFDYMGLKKNVSTQIPAALVNPFQSATTATSFATHWLYTLRGRVGVTQGDWLFYATGGLALSRISYTANYTNLSFALPPPFLFENEAASAAATRAGWTVGAGVERKITGTRWSGKLEYLYADFGSITAMGQISTLGVPDRIFLINHVPFNVQILRAGLNYSLN